MCLCWKNLGREDAQHSSCELKTSFPNMACLWKNVLIWIKRCLVHFQLCAQRQKITLSCWAVHPSNSPPTEVRPPFYGTLLTPARPLSSMRKNCNFGTLLRQYTNLNVMMNGSFQCFAQAQCILLVHGLAGLQCKLILFAEKFRRLRIVIASREWIVEPIIFT